MLADRKSFRYATRMSTVPPTPLSASGAEFAAFRPRAIAFLIDMVPLYVAGLVLTSIMPGFGGVLWLVGVGAYFTYFTAGKWQASPGKRYMKLMVIRTDGQPVDRTYAIGRTAGYLASSAIFGLGFFLPLFTAEKTALHDLLADTRVVHGKR